MLHHLVMAKILVTLFALFIPSPLRDQDLFAPFPFVSWIKINFTLTILNTNGATRVNPGLFTSRGIPGVVWVLLSQHFYFFWIFWH